jgi:UDP-N-acetylglucosamine 2-epimerase
MYDVLRWRLSRPDREAGVAAGLGLEIGHYALATVHRAENTDDPRRLAGILDGLGRIAASGLPVVLPLHPRTRAVLGDWRPPEHLHVLPPVSYDPMVDLEAGARVVLTDSGGVQKEAYWAGVPCVTMRRETEWTETVAAGWNTLVDTDPDRIAAAALAAVAPPERPDLYGDGHAADLIADALVSSHAGSAG